MHTNETTSAARFVSLRSRRIFPSPDVTDFLDVLHRTNMSVLYVAANFKPLKANFMIAPYVAMAEGEGEGDDDGGGEKVRMDEIR